MNVFRLIFRIEIIISALSAAAALLVPQQFVAGFYPEGAVPAGVDLFRWYGALGVPFAWIFWRALDWEWEKLRDVVIAYLIGDVLYFFALVMTIQNGGTWGVSAISAAIITIVVGTTRVISLLRPSLLVKDVETVRV